MADFVIRSAVVADIPVLIRHRRLMWIDMGRTDEKMLDLMDHAATAYFSTAVADGSYRGFLAARNTGEIVGGGGIVISHWPGIWAQPLPRRAMILNVFVEREYRRQGIARRVMNEMIAWCRANGFANVGLHASDEGRPLYEQLGFKPTNEMRLNLK